MSTFASFQPAVAQRYWQAIRLDDLEAAVAVIEQDDWPLFDDLMRLPAGFDAGVHALLEIFGVAPRWRRAPFPDLDDARSSGWTPSTASAAGSSDP